MINKRPRMVALGLALLLSACAHQQPYVENNSTKSGNSLGWPLRSEGVDGGAENSIDSDGVHAAVQSPVDSSITKRAPAKIPSILPQKVFANHSVKPRSIKVPRAKDTFTDSNEESVDASFDTPLIFDIPVAYNSRVKYWIEYFQTSGRSWFTKWLERSSRYLPLLQQTLKRNGLPQDLAYMAMIESGFSSQASSTAQAVGPWQFIRETGKRYGLQVSWWLDERRDFQKSTEAASKYLKKMYGMFHNWYLVAAGPGVCA